MGKKSKKLNINNNTQDEVPVTNAETLNDLQNLQSDKFKKQNYLDSEINSAMKSKKKKRKRNDDFTIEDTSVQINSDEMNNSSFPAGSTNTEIKKKRKKNQSKLSEQEIVADTQSDVLINEMNANDKQTTKKKKKNNNVSDDTNKQETVPAHVKVEHKLPKNSKKQNNNHDMLSGLLSTEEIKKKDGEINNKKKSRKKAKTGAPVLNDEEAQVTQEDIDKFCDELNEEDNKQYEDWV